LRFCVNNSDISPTFKWPARTAAGAWNPETGCRMERGCASRRRGGKRTPTSFLACIPNPGSSERRCAATPHPADGSGGSTIQVQGVQILRWEKDLVSRLNSSRSQRWRWLPRRPCCELQARPICGGEADLDADVFAGESPVAKGATSTCMIKTTR